MSKNLLDVFQENELLRAHAFYSTILIGKMLIMSPMTIRQRLKHKAFINAEDIKEYGDKYRISDHVERIRRCHQNDLENIVPFIGASFLYTLTNPSPTLALNLFRTYTAVRVLHTIVYTVCVVRQPARFVLWLAGYGITAFMTVSCLMHFYA